MSIEKEEGQLRRFLRRQKARLLPILLPLFVTTFLKYFVLVGIVLLALDIWAKQN